jgi:putative methionine-R-sulfoxide reductase with GAF domain
MNGFADALGRTAAYLSPHRDALVETWTRALVGLTNSPTDEANAFCARTVDSLLGRLSRGEIDALLADEGAAAAEAARTGASFHPLALAIRVLDRCCLPYLLAACPDRESLGESLLALDELGDRRLEVLLGAQEEESQRRLVDAQEQAARAEEKAREVARGNEALRRSESRSQHRAEQIALLHTVSRRVAAILDSERLLQEAADAIRAMGFYTYVAVVILDAEGVLVGRWAGRPGLGRHSSGRTQGPARGIIGRALRKKAPQVVGDVAVDVEYFADVAGTRSEMAVPLIEGGQAVGALDFQSEELDGFDLDDVAAAEALAEFLVVALRNTRLFAAQGGAGGPG